MPQVPDHRVAMMAALLETAGAGAKRWDCSYSTLPNSAQASISEGRSSSNGGEPRKPEVVAFAGVKTFGVSDMWEQWSVAEACNSGYTRVAIKACTVLGLEHPESPQGLTCCGQTKESRR